MRAVIAGSTGEIGKHLLNDVLTSDACSEVVTFIRRPNQMKNSRLMPVVVDFDSLQNATLDAIDVAFCCLGTTMKQAGSKEAFTKVDLDYVVNFAKKVKAAGATQFHVVSALGANKNSSIFYNQIKGRMQQAIIDMKFDSTYIYQPSLLISDRQEIRKGERIAIVFFKAFNFLFIGPLKKYAGIPVSKVAKGMLQRCLNAKPGVHIIESDKI